MPNLTNYLAGDGTTASFDPAYIVDRLQRSIVLVRGNTEQAAQIVATAYVSQNNAEVMGEANNQAGTLTLYLVGDVDFDVAAQDRFELDGVWYRVAFVATYPGKVEARCEGRQ